MVVEAYAESVHRFGEGDQTVGGETIKSGVDIVKDFINALEADSSLDEGVVASLSHLLKEDKLTPTRLMQALEAERKKRTASG